MKKILLLPIVLLISTSLWAQKFAFVDSEYILNKIPSYKAAQEQLDKLSEQYQKEIEDKYAEIDKMYKDYQTEKVLLTQEMQKKREDEIISRERQTKELQMKYFGRDGLLFKKREELVKPIQDQVFNAVKEIAIEGGYAIIFDAAASPNMLYTNPRYDKSEDVLLKLGYK
ncbi:MAG TPA: OmpH family outer membrane protein [Tenuifilaceae bacterium]|jgi:outer membrane protein|nr:OmpH family outer membrane protein [Bacteroidales bacterium]HNY09757.1 OmpH family outer membrane protein [Tenuifilaceae bacterium]HOA08847.1 OmpH family outer membrane protein [Tenuifilaceae bacterium]HOC35809.1 OmpH family outer membrane protein [Tenuifilaceae bacterium]HOG71471.1 OmpH family outer membrane protein [Tenuifilaceae bacterium]